MDPSPALSLWNSPALFWAVAPVWALGFANSIMLWGAAGASLPILIHLLNRRRFKRVRWAAMQFLLAAVKKNQRRIQLEQLLLLAVRTLIVLLAALAMAKPFLESSGLPLVAGQRTHLILALDGSMSMTYQPAESTRFDQAKAAARQLLKEARPGDVASVVLLGASPRIVVGEPSPRLDEVAREIDDLQATHGGTDLAASFDAIARAMDASTISQKQLIILTDLQASSWRQPAAAEGVKVALAKLSRDGRSTRSVVVDLGKENTANRAVVDLDLNTQVVTVGTPFTVRATARNFSTIPADSTRARLVVDGQFVNERVIESWPSGEEAVVAFTHTLVTPGDHVVEVRLDEDPLVVDDRRRLVIPTREVVQVLLVDGDAKAEPFQSETDYLAEALAPASAGASGLNEPVSAIRVEVVSESQLAGRDLSRYDAIAVCNIAQFTEREVTILESYLRQGGGVAIFLGNQTLPDNANRLLFADGKGLLPAEIVGVVGDETRRGEPVGFNTLGLRHPIVAPFAGASESVIAGLTGVRTWRYYQLKLPEDSPARVALAFETGDPALIETDRHRGKVILSATTADADWTTWPLHPSYPPVMEQILLQAASGRFAARNAAVGQPLDQTYPPSGSGLDARLTRPDEEVVTVRLRDDPDGAASLFRYENTDLSGVYQARIGPPLAAEASFAVNPPPAESDPARISEADLRAEFPGWDFRVVTSSKASDSPTTSALARQGELHRPLLWAVLALLLFESVLAWWFGYHTAPA